MYHHAITTNVLKTFLFGELLCSSAAVKCMGMQCSMVLYVYGCSGARCLATSNVKHDHFSCCENIVPCCGTCLLRPGGSKLRQLEGGARRWFLSHGRPIREAGRIG